MTIPIDPALVARLSGEFITLADDFTGLGGRMSTLGRDLEALHRHVLSAAPAPDAPAGRADEPAAVPKPDAGSRGEPRAACPDSVTGRAAPEKTTATPGPVPGVPATGVRVGGVHTPDTPGAAASAPGGAASGPGDPAPRQNPEVTAVPSTSAGKTNEPHHGPAGHAQQAGEPGRPGPAQAHHVPAAPGAQDPAQAPRDTSPAQSAPAAAPREASVHMPHGARAWTGPAGSSSPAQGQMPWGAPPQPPGRARTAAYYPQVGQRYPGAGYPGPVPPRPMGAPGPVPPRIPWWQREGVISRVLAVAGVGVTLIGVVMLLVLAAQAGVFGPVPRVLAGAVFSAVLVGAGMRVYHRAGGRVGGIALAATGFAGAYLDVIAVTAIYDWLHPVPGFAVALGVAAAGVGLAVQWRAQPLAVLVVGGAAVLAPFVTTELALLAFLIVLQLACVPVQYRFDWPFLHLVRTVPAVLATQLTIVGFVIDRPDDHRPVLLLTAAVAVAAIGLVGTLVIVRARPGDLVASLTFALTITPLLAAPALFERPATTAIAAVYAVVLLGVAATTLLPAVRDIARVPGHTALVAAVGGSFALLETCWDVTTGDTLPIALFLVGTCYLGVAGQARNRAATFLGIGYGVIGGLTFLVAADPDTLASQLAAADGLSIATAASAIAGLGLVAVGLWALRRVFGSSIDEAGTTLLWIGGSAVALYLVTAATVSFGVASGAADGFVIGHSIATIVWMAGALAALQYGLRNLGAGTTTTAKVALGSGLLVSAAALAKLFLFDLATLGGLIRVAAFLVVGILLLVAGTRYARAFAETGAREPGTEADSSRR
ncbi:DUF2339 domain-containing protein [Nocardia sp. CA-290969]|uniref:DUF2339 domain-containing protein n=1 Tax=Nocardia sp. CA-290969 TaxID=3239986 RepID=UPI003D94921B